MISAAASASSAPGAGWRTSGTAVRRPGRRGSGLGESRGRYLPGAQQLELLRRLNQAGRPSAALADSVLAASAAGRGRPDLELAGAVPESAFGPAPVDPAALPAGELVRVAASLLADQVADAGLPEPEVRRGAVAGGGAATAWSATPSSPTRSATSWSRGAARPAAASRASWSSAATWPP